ncbi:PASTA domain-containing protein [Phytohabitans aurantiacus]|uniref:PASTA domain-containing protein n=1 Tax=Phytohabitans aurantiacus TaxID=3016789 RepID=A0ABQ5R676_9ACTN|nr:PASTA domain-containing protein [Phytohabitans aurantiacus]GLI01056.1 hypothetical protein Pa4123_63320 [Phytohabitans aurantiacus]
MTSPAVPILNFGGPAGRRIAVPDVVGKEKAEAEKILKEAGLRCRSQDAESFTPLGKVVSQEPAQGKTVPPNTQVLINIAIAPPGPPPDFDKLFKELKDAVAAASAELGQVRADVTQVKADVGSVKTEVTQVKSEVGTVNTHVTQVKADVVAVTTAVQTVETEVDAKGRHDVLVQKLDDIAAKLKSAGAGPGAAKKA